MITTLNTGNKTLDMEIPLLNAQELDELARYAGYLRWSRAQTGAKDGDVVMKRPVSVEGLTGEQMNAELEKGYSDMLEVRTTSVDKAFSGIRGDYERGLPFTIRQPGYNEETETAMQEARNERRGKLQ